MKSIFKFLKMKKITFLFLLVLFSEPFALTLEQVKKALQENAIPQDSVEMNLRVTVKSTGVYQQTDIYTVSKGSLQSVWGSRQPLNDKPKRPTPQKGCCYTANRDTPQNNVSA